MSRVDEILAQIAEYENKLTGKHLSDTEMDDVIVELDKMTLELKIELAKIVDATREEEKKFIASLKG